MNDYMSGRMNIRLHACMNTRMNARRVLLLTAAMLPLATSSRVDAQSTQTAPTSTTRIDRDMLLLPDAVFDGTALRSGWAVHVRGSRIVAAGPAASLNVPAGVERVSLAGQTLLPGLIDLHSHVLLHPYDETSWNDQVLRESQAVRVARAVNHARATLMAGFTTLRDLGTEGADYADVGIKEAIDQGIIPGPRLFITTRAIVATGSYGPKGFASEMRVPQGAEEADGVEGLTRAVRNQIGHGADWIKIYADYRWGPRGEARPTFGDDEWRAIVETARSSGRPVVAHASTAEGMRRAIVAGVETIEHGDAGTAETWALMKAKNVALCPTLAATESTSRYRGWKKGVDADPTAVTGKKAMLRAALAAGVTICNGSDVGVFSHGDNALELELLVEYGLTPAAALQAATSTNARLLHREAELGRIAPGFVADLLAVRGNPVQNISQLRAVRFVMKNGTVVRHDRD